ncbi:MAG: carboxymuconolactone decarboxylase family protein [Anaerolineae bacterium]|nr:carboxymuconolactone decarboxylase family protein [Anaerolineae bacterium]
MTHKRPFPRRAYHRPSEALQDLRFLWQQRARIRRAMRQLISPAFRERLMLTVTQVNGCRYCSYAHARMSLTAGLAPEELRQLLQGVIPADTPADELPALLYAQHWAESDAHPDPQMEERLEESYGAETAQAIHIILRMIRMGNLLGNTLDAVLFHLSGGHVGLTESEARRL